MSDAMAVCFDVAVTHGLFPDGDAPFLPALDSAGTAYADRHGLTVKTTPGRLRLLYDPARHVPPGDLLPESVVVYVFFRDGHFPEYSDVPVPAPIDEVISIEFPQPPELAPLPEEWRDSAARIGWDGPKPAALLRFSPERLMVNAPTLTIHFQERSVYWRYRLRPTRPYAGRFVIRHKRHVFVPDVESDLDTDFISTEPIALPPSPETGYRLVLEETWGERVLVENLANPRRDSLVPTGGADEFVADIVVRL